MSSSQQCRSEYPFLLSAEVPADTPRTEPLEQSFEAPYDALITRVEVGFPNGVQQAVGVQLSNAVGTNWIPRGGTTSTVGSGEREPEYITENDATLEASLNVVVDEGEPVQAAFISNDPNENHFVTVNVYLQEREAGDA